MGTKLTNNATGRLAVSLTAASTQLSMVVGDAVKFPTIAAGSGDNFPLTAVKANGELEIMLCTLTNGNVFTVQRGQEGTSPKAFSAGDRIELRLTAGTIDGMIDDRIDAAIEVVLEDLGTAAYADLTTSPTDGTIGRALKVGDWGIGAATLYNENNRGGMLYYGPHNLPTNYPLRYEYGTILSISHGFRGFNSEIVISHTDNTQIAFRASQLSPWREIYHTGNLPITASRWPTWSEVTSKPTTFTPSAHNHSWSNITSGVPDTATRWPTWSEVTSKPATATRWPSWGEVSGKPSTFTPPTEHGGVGTYAWVSYRPSDPSKIYWGGTIKGSSITPTGGGEGPALAGTWRVMGASLGTSSAPYPNPLVITNNLAVRIL